MTLRIGIAAAATALLLGLVGGVAGGLVGPALAQAPDDPLPDGPGKDAVVRVCTACHDAAEFAYARYEPAQWDAEISKMQSAGAEMTAAEQLAISAYLARYLSPQAEEGPGPATGAIAPSSRIAGPASKAGS